jgi:hypothetical protein
MARDMSDRVSSDSSSSNRAIPTKGSTSNTKKLPISENTVKHRPISENTKMLREINDYAADTPKEIAARQRENEKTEAINPNKIGEWEENESPCADLIEMNEFSCLCADVVDSPGTNEEICPTSCEESSEVINMR